MRDCKQTLSPMHLGDERRPAQGRCERAADGRQDERDHEQRRAHEHDDRAGRQPRCARRERGADIARKRAKAGCDQHHRGGALGPEPGRDRRDDHQRDDQDEPDDLEPDDGNPEQQPHEHEVGPSHVDAPRPA
jgi:hypothetical protein